jgi:CheY-like chemotaxis protein
MRKSKILESLFPGTRHAILSAAYLEPGRWFDQACLAERAGVPPWHLEGELDCLVSAGVLLGRTEGGAREVRANSGCPFFAEIQTIVSKAALEAGSASGAILVVEDEPATLKVARILLESWGYQVLLAGSGAEALDLFQRQKDAIRLVLTDIVMQGMNGMQLAEKLVQLDSDVRIICMSGYHTEGLKQIGGRPITFLPKPFSPERLARSVREELEKP